MFRNFRNPLSVRRFQAFRGLLHRGSFRARADGRKGKGAENVFSISLHDVEK